jgi:hypothetical protein
MKFPVSPVVAALFLMLAHNIVSLPVITRQPTPATNSVSLGANLTNRVTASSTNAALTFQWRLNGLEIPGATTNSLTLLDIRADQAGLYTVVVSDSTGSIESRSWGVQVDTTFTKITSGPIVSESNGTGIAWADIDNDQWPELIVTGASGASVFRNNRDGTFTKDTSSGLAPIGNFSALCLADIDNDGWLDAVTVAQFKQSLFRNLGQGTFQRMDDSPVSLANVKSITTAWADYDNDGNIDLFIAADKNYLFHNLGGGAFTNVALSAGLGTAGGAQSCAWGDYNNDNYPDLYVCNAPNQKNFLFRNNRDGTFTRIISDPVVADTANFSGCSWGDYDNDGYLDLFVSTFGPRNFLYHNERNGTFKKVTNTPLSSDGGHSYNSAWVDYDNDGNLDLYVCNGGNDFAGVRKDFFYHNLGGGKFVRILTGSMINEDGWTYGCAWGDYNRDGFPDLFVGNIYDTGNNALFRNNGNSNSWVSVSCAGRLSNRAAIGAKVRAKATIRGLETWQMREISGGSGAGCQPEMTIGFGLGDANLVDLLRIEWPSGIVQELTNVPTRQFLTVKEPSKLTPANLQPDGLQTLALQGAPGITYSLETSENLVNWIPLIFLTNQTGRILWTNQSPAYEPLHFYRAVEF